MLYRRALNIRQTLLGEKHPDTAQVLKILFFLYMFKTNNVFTFQSHNSLGCLYQDLGDYETADYHLQLAVSLRESLLGKSVSEKCCILVCQHNLFVCVCVCVCFCSKNR